MKRRAALAAVFPVLLVVAGCGAARATVAPPKAPTTRAVTYVAIGGSDSTGAGSADPLLDAWTQVFFRTALPRSTVFIDLAVPGSTTAQALSEQLSEALTLDPRIATISLGVTDLFDGVLPATFGSELRRLMSSLRTMGATSVLVANIPPLEQFPAYKACLAGTAATENPEGGSPFTCPDPIPTPSALEATVASYNSVIAADVRATGAILVDLHSAGLTAVQHGTEASLIGDDGIDPSEAGDAAIAKLFTDAFASRNEPTR